MKERFEFGRKYEGLAIGILNCALGITSLAVGFLNSWFSLGWSLIGLGWILRFRSSQKHGYLQIDDTYIQINHTGFRGIEKVLKNDIDKIVFKPRLYVIHRLGKRKRGIYKGNLSKESIPLLENIFNSMNEEINSNRPPAS